MAVKFPDKAAQAKLRKQVAQKLAQGRAKIEQLEKKVRSGEAGREITAELKKAKAKLEKLKAQYKAQEKKAMDYVAKNPKKAVMAAAAVGLLAGAVLAALKSPKKK